LTHSVSLGRRTELDVAATEIGRTQELLAGMVHPDRLFRPFGGGGNLDDRLLNESVVEFSRNAR
jgi:hypothetical protein